jgi:hypothetical protein
MALSAVPMIKPEVASTEKKRKDFMEVLSR